MCFLGEYVEKEKMTTKVAIWLKPWKGRRKASGEVMVFQLSVVASLTPLRNLRKLEKEKEGAA